MNNKLLQFLCIIIASFAQLFLCANTIADEGSTQKEPELGKVEEALGVKRGECKNPPCSTDIDSLIDRLMVEDVKKQESLEMLRRLKEKNKKNKFNSLVEMNTAKIMVLNKITSKSRQETLKLREVAFFGNLSIELHRCVKNTDPLNGNSLMLLTILDNHLEDDNLSVFHGWVLSSNPSISTLEHAIYEIIPLDCFMVEEKRPVDPEDEEPLDLDRGKPLDNNNN
ncbi:MAG: hypothetical protein COA94_02540 [Rickettsiales bacterium]|nr:MAG: hypothetical protein COA94_02540 [Rickettsiales bacterium]